MLSFEALAWLKSVGYGEKNHEERMALIKAAKILFTSDEDEDPLCFEQEQTR